MQKRQIIPIIILVIASSFVVWQLFQQKSVQHKGIFNPERAFNDVLNQINLGPRTPGSAAHSAVITYITEELKQAGWKVEIQIGERMGHPIQNIIARRETGSQWVILGAHYDSRLYADEEPDAINAAQPVMGANDGASGVAVLLELARTLPKDIDKKMWLVFFDAEDQGRLEGWDWILGSRLFAETLTAKPDAVVVIDMIGDADLNIYREQASDKELNDEIWQTAASLGFSEFFIDEEKYYILDDHIPFINAGIPAADIIDIDYPYYHTHEDTEDKVSPQSLNVIGTTLLKWLEK